jgi:probable HAF family extracellular repeat protein
MKVTRKTLSSMSGISGLLAVAVFVLTLVAPVRAQEREYSTIAPPGARSSTAFGINARGDVVGSFADQNFVTHGFLLSKGEFTVIDFRDSQGILAQGTIARGISPSGEIVGSYRMSGDPAVAARGFLLTRKGEFVDVRYPGHSWEVAQRILSDGTILGCRHDYDQMESMRGVMIGTDGASEIDAFSSMNNGATPDLRLIVGWWVDMMVNPPLGQTQGYMIENGIFTPFMVPGSNSTAAWDVNPDGAIVGVYSFGTTVRGFVKTGESYTTIHYPGSTTTRAFGINARGDIVGNYVVGGVTRAFLAREVEE